MAASGWCSCPRWERAMAQLDQQPIRNGLLTQLPRSDFNLLAKHLQPVECELSDVLIEANAPIERAYFPEDSITSILAKTSESRIEVGLIGREGLVGASVALGVGRVPYRFLVQGAGSALAIPAVRLRIAIESNQALRELIGRYVHVLSVQTA